MEKILKTAPVRQLFTKGLQNAQICLTMAKNNQGTSSNWTHELIYASISEFFLEHVVLQISNSAKKEFGKNIKNCARETAFCDGPSESSNLFNHGK